MKTVNLTLLVLLLVIVAANLVVGVDPALPARDYFPEMVYSRAAESYGGQAAFAGGATLQSPPEFTLARGASLVRYAPTPADALRAGLELTAPPADPADVQRGQTTFQTFCTPCHGGRGEGDGVIVARGYPPPPSLLAVRARAMKDGQMFHVVSYGQQNMPAYASQIETSDRWRVVAYVRTLHGGNRP